MGPQTLIAGALALFGGGGVATIIVAIVNGRFGLAAKRDELASAAEVTLQQLVDARAKALIEQLGARVDDLEAETRGLRDELKRERATREGLEGEVGTLRRENASLRTEVAGLRTQVARLTGLAAGAEADTAGGDDD